MIIYLIRDAECVRDGRFLGRREVPLTDRGREQAARLAAYFADIPLRAVFSSPLGRAVDTARPLAQAQHKRVRRRRELTEIHAGWWEGLTDEQRLARWPKHFRRWRAKICIGRCPGGETMPQMAARVQRELQRLGRRYRRGAIAVVLHGWAIRAMVSWWAAGSLRKMRCLRMAPNASVTVAEFDGKRFHLRGASDYEHVRDVLTR